MRKKFQKISRSFAHIAQREDNGLVISYVSKLHATSKKSVYLVGHKLFKFLNSEDKPFTWVDFASGNIRISELQLTVFIILEKRSDWIDAGQQPA